MEVPALGAKQSRFSASLHSHVVCRAYFDPLHDSASAVRRWKTPFPKKAISITSRVVLSHCVKGLMCGLVTPHLVSNEISPPIPCIRDVERLDPKSSLADGVILLSLMRGTQALLGGASSIEVKVSHGPDAVPRIL